MTGHMKLAAKKSYSDCSLAALKRPPAACGMLLKEAAIFP